MSEIHSETALQTAYVRREMLDQQTPPVTAAGPVKWMRENLFSSIPNGIMTVLSLFVIYYILSHLLGWFANGIWDAGSLTECRAIRDERIASGVWSEGTEVACWGVLADRWDQLLFGFYPSDLYWRPILAVVLFLAAMAPILYDSLPRKLLILTLVAPFLCFWLLWGGSIWYPYMVAMGFLLGWAIIKFASVPLGSLVANLAAIVLPLLFWLFAAGPLASALTDIAPIGIRSVNSREFGGFLLAVVIGASGIILSMPLGIALALGRQSDLFIINKCSVIFIEVIRGVPLIVWLFTAQLLLGYFLPPGTNFDLMLRVIIMVTLFSSAYIAEVIRGGLAALPRGQYEGADSLGLNYWQAMQLIILPQALKISIPGIVSSFIGLFKDTTLVVFIGMLDPIGFSNAIRADTDWNGIYWELFIFIGLCFFICCFSMSRYSQYLERKLATDHR